MIEIHIDYEGDLHCRAVHGPSGAQIATDAPLDNEGRGAAFSPTDLTAASLGTCMVTIMGIYARRKGLPIDGTKVRVGKEMGTAPPRRIARLALRIEVPLPPDHPECRALVAAADGCPVKRSLHPEVAVEVEWIWTGA